MDKTQQSILKHPYLPGIALFLVALIIGLLTYHDYGICWDEPFQRGPGVLSYNYIMHGSQELFIKASDNHGAGFELPLVYLEKWLHLTDTRDIYLMRHIVAHVFFLIGVFAAYVLIYKLFRNRFIASLGFFMLAFMPRLYAHSFFNTKDMPFLTMFIVSLAICYTAFEKDRTWLFFLLGLSVGYATSIRIMGIMLAVFIILFLVADVVFKLLNKERPLKQLCHMAVFILGFCILLYIPWPYIWKQPVHMFLESFGKMSHYDWKGAVLFDGEMILSDSTLPWTYFPTWFMITIPELWLIAGFIGIIVLIAHMFKKPLLYIKNTHERNFLLYMICFFAPVISVIFLHSVIYDDWRHLYFVYPPFVFMALYFLHKLIISKYAKVVEGICALQAAVVIAFMVQAHPFNQVYFNNFVSHKEEYLRRNYDMEYWGCSFKQGLDHLLVSDTSANIKICCEYVTMLNNNVMLLRPEDRKRISFAMFDQADYYMSNFRLHPDDYPGKDIEYQIEVENSTILRVYKLKGTAIKLR